MTNQKIYKKIKRTGITGSIIWFLILFALASTVCAESAIYFTKYIRDSKFNKGYDTVSYMEKLYEEGIASGTDTAVLYRLLDKTGHDYIITDASGNILHLNGRDTRKDSVQNARLGISSKSIDMYVDAEISDVHPDKNGVMTVDLKTLWNLMRDNAKSAFSLGSDEDDDLIEEDPEDDDNIGIDNENWEKIANYYDEMEDQGIVELPFWVSFDIERNNEKLIAKTCLTATGKDLVMFFVLGLALALVILAIFIYSFVSIIRAFKRQRRIVNYFFTDPVTGGHNWMWFQIKGDQLLKKHRNRDNNYAVVSLSLINYRNYCVCHSVADGEKLLARINAEICLNLTKKEMCAHNSSSSFAMIMRYDTEDELRQRINMLILRLETIDPGHKFAYQAGVCLVDKVLDSNGRAKRRKSVSLQNEYNNASSARSTLAESDDSGVAFFDEKIVEDQKWLDSVQERQNQAIANEEFIVYYQPKYDPRTNELRGAEALIRWQSPNFGFVAPYKFIPIFEKNGFITEIDHYMLSHVARDQRRWLDAGLKCVPVSVNVSRAHFIESDLAEQIRDTVSSFGCPHELIEIELTESAFFDDKKAMIETITRLKSYGFAVSMDDFGAGYSSLNSLKDMPLDVLKLDADFFRGESAGGRGEIVVSEAIKLAKSLNMRIVAEGVEVREQVDFLAGEGCDMIQGYYFAKPMPGDDYEQRMRTGVEYPEAAAEVAVPVAGDVSEAEAAENAEPVSTNENTVTDDTVSEAVIEAVGDESAIPVRINESPETDGMVSEAVNEAEGTESVTPVSIDETAAHTDAETVSEAAEVESVQTVAVSEDTVTEEVSPVIMTETEAADSAEPLAETAPAVNTKEIPSASEASPDEPENPENIRIFTGQGYDSIHSNNTEEENE